jgi:hypothetical protein
MRRQFSLILTLAAWLIATGSQWDLVQTFAWSRMIAGYSQTMPLLQAVAKTFSPDTMCGICRAVAVAKQRTDANPAVPGAKAPQKILLVCAPIAPAFAFPAAHCAGMVSDLAPPISAERPAPPNPPPRTLA